MTTTTIGAEWRPYLRMLAESGLDVATVGAWVAAAELPRARRRLARGALTAVTVAAAVPGIRAVRAAVGAADAPQPGAGSGLPYIDVGIRLPTEEPSGDGPSRRRRVVLAAAVGAAVLITAGGVAAGSHLQRRWLARLVRQGHPHPHRALGVRMAAVYAAVAVPSRLLAVRQGERPRSGD